MSEHKSFITTEYFEEILNRLPEGLFFIDPEGKIVKINPAFTEILGYEPKEIIGKSFVDLRHDLSQASDTLKKRTEDFGLYFFHLSEKNATPMIMRHKEGHAVPVRLRSILIRNSSGQTDATLGIIERETVGGKEILFDSEEVLDKKIWEMEQNYRSILDYSGDAILISDFNTRVVTVNNAMFKMLDYTTPDELLGKHLAEIGPYEGTFTSTTGEVITFDERWQKAQIDITDSLFENGIVHCELYLFKKNNNVVPVEATISLLKDKKDGRRGAISIFRDVTRRKLTDKKLLDIQHELEERVKERTENLEEVNAALNVLLKKREEDKNELEEKILFRVNELVMPYLDKLKKSQLSERQETYLTIAEKNLKEVGASLSQRLSALHKKLTPMEIQVANLVQQGKTNKEIAEILNLSAKTIESHRKNIRTKFGIKNQKTNLRSYLLSLENR
jgi:PAS domain S-box-containing protein